MTPFSRGPIRIFEPFFWEIFCVHLICFYPHFHEAINRICIPFSSLFKLNLNLNSQFWWKSFCTHDLVMLKPLFNIPIAMKINSFIFWAPFCCATFILIKFEKWLSILAIWKIKCESEKDVYLWKDNKSSSEYHQDLKTIKIVWWNFRWKISEGWGT